MVTKIRPFMDNDADLLSALVGKTLTISNCQDYPEEVLSFMMAYFSPQGLKKMAKDRSIYVMEEDGRLLGTIARKEDHLLALYVDPDAQGRGIGKALVDFIEKDAKDHGIPSLQMDASLTAETFYRNLGYTGSEKEYDQHFGWAWRLSKTL